MLAIRRQAPTLAVYGDTGHFSHLLKQQVQTLKYWARSIALSDNSILKNAYNCLLGVDSRPIGQCPDSAYMGWNKPD